MAGNVCVFGSLETGSQVRISDNYSADGAAVEVEPFWCHESEAMKMRIRCFACSNDRKPQIELIWDQMVLKHNGTVVAR